MSRDRREEPKNIPKETLSSPTRLWWLIPIVAVLVATLVGGGVFINRRWNAYQDYLARIRPGVTIAGLDVGGMTPDEAGALVRRAISVRTTDAAGLPLRELKPEVTVVSGGGEVLSVFSDDATCPGLFEVDIRMGPSPGDNVFRIEAGGLSDEVTIQGQ